MAKPTFTDEFKQGVVQYVLDHPDESKLSIAKRFDIADSTVHKWVKDAFKTMEYIDEKEAVEIVLNDSEETLIYHKSPEEEYFTREALKHETINFDKESEIEEDLDELEK